jgi:hypothetical protein
LNVDVRGAAVGRVAAHDVDGADDGRESVGVLVGMEELAEPHPIRPVATHVLDEPLSADTLEESEHGPAQRP